MNPATFPGPGNLWTRDLCATLDERAERVREQIEQDLRHALIRGHYLNWGTPGQSRLYLAADELQGEVSGIAETDEISPA